jgi:hypothetical protein
MRVAKRGAWAAVGTALTILLVAPSQRVQAQARVEVGVLTCTAHGGTSFLVTSTKDLRCRFQRSGRDEFYRGTISKFGLDVGATQVTSITWAVLAPTSKLPRRSLSGNYGGVGAEATLGVGVGANALVGGSSGGIILQPLSVQAQQGLNVAAGVESLQLQARE